MGMCFDSTTRKEYQEAAQEVACSEDVARFYDDITCENRFYSLVAPEHDALAWAGDSDYEYMSDYDCFDSYHELLDEKFYVEVA